MWGIILYYTIQLFGGKNYKYYEHPYQATSIMESKRVFYGIFMAHLPPQKIDHQVLSLQILRRHFAGTLEANRGMPIVATQSSLLFLASLVFWGIIFWDDATPQPQATK